MFPWSWQSCSRCEGQQESHILIKDQGAKNKTPPAGAALRDSRRCEKALQCTRFNYHAYTLGLLLRINVSRTGPLLRKPLAVRNVPQCTLSLGSRQLWQRESHATKARRRRRWKEYINSQLLTASDVSMTLCYYNISIQAFTSTCTSENLTSCHQADVTFPARAKFSPIFFFPIISSPFL